MKHIQIVNSLPNRVVSINSTEYLFFSGTNYLGIANDDGFRGILFDAFKNYGSIYSASRNNNLRLSIFEEVESKIATENSFEDALLTSSGIFAGQLVINFLKEKKIIYCPSAHPAIRNSNERMTVKEFNSNLFFEELFELLNKINFPVIIAANIVDNITCGIINFNWLKNLPVDKNITLLFDFSHGIGIMNLDNNILEAIPKFDTIIVASLAKAIGIPAGIILSTRKNISKIRSNPLFAGASPPIPSYLEAFLKSEKIYLQKRYLLQKNIDYFDKLNSYPFQSIPDFPVYSTKDNIYQKLFQRKIFVSHFPYPTSKDQPLTRIVLNASHTFSDIEKLTNNLNKIKKISNGI